MTTSDNVPDKLVGALASGLRIIRFLSLSSAPVGVSRVARELQLNPSTCFNLLKTLSHEGIINFNSDTKTYSIGLGLVELAKGALSNASYTRLARPCLEDIASRFDVTTTLWQRTSGERVVLVDYADSESEISVHMRIGQRLPMFMGALGRVMAAFSGLGKSELRDRYNQLRWARPPGFDEYYRDVQEAQKVGYATDSDNFVAGVCITSAAVLDEVGRPVMAISAVGFSAYTSGENLARLGKLMSTHASRISAALSGRPS